MRNKRDFVPRLCISTCSRRIKLRSAYILCYFIRNRRCSLIFLSGFTNAEYRIALVDFIVALRRTKGRRRRTLRSPSPPSSGLHLLTPGLSSAAGHDCCRGFGAILDSGIRCCRSSPVPNMVWLSVFGSVSFAFQSGCWAGIFRFLLLGGWSFVPAVTWRFAFSFVGFALTAGRSFVLLGNGVG